MIPKHAPSIWHLPCFILYRVSDLQVVPRDYIPIQDWFVALVAAFCAAYLFIFYDQMSARPGIPTTLDLVVGVIGLILLLEATRRALGPPLMAVAAVFLVYTFFGPYMPEVIAHKGASLTKGMSHYWLSTEGVFGVALGVSTGMVFMFVLFGSLLESAGAGNYFIRTAYAGLGHMRGGPAKAAVVSSGLTGLVSGSSIANVVTTGTFTIPLMKKWDSRRKKPVPWRWPLPPMVSLPHRSWALPPSSWWNMWASPMWR